MPRKSASYVAVVLFTLAAGTLAVVALSFFSLTFGSAGKGTAMQKYIYHILDLLAISACATILGWIIFFVFH